MKNKLFIYVGLAASLLCSCAQSDVDNGQGQQGSKVLHITATAPGGDTRVSVGEDVINGNGLITKWTSSDQLTVWNSYSGTELTGLPFSKTTATEEQTALFDHSGSTNFTPGSTIYAFNSLPSGTYDHNYNSGTFVISLSGYGSQNGTLANMAQYDALCGTTTAKNDGTSSSLLMNHLTAAMCFNFINADFTTGTNLTKFAVNCATTGNSILPVSCNATLGADGNITFGTLNGTTQWLVDGSSIPAANGALKVYLMTFPFKNISGSLEFIAKTSTAGIDKYYWRKVTMQNLNLSAGFVQNRPANLIPIDLPHVDVLKNNYYEWDAYLPQGTGSATFGSTGYVKNTNPTTSSFDKVATHGGCGSCPTARQIYAYLLAGAYIDLGDAILMDDGSYSYPPSYHLSTSGTIFNNYDPFTHALVSGSSKGIGLWLPKNAYIKSTLSSTLGWGATNGVADYTGTPEINKDKKAGKVTTPALAASIRNSGNYFYLPSTGACGVTGDPGVGNGIGNYWSSSPIISDAAYSLRFETDLVSIASGWARNNGFYIWTIQ